MLLFNSFQKTDKHGAEINPFSLRDAYKQVLNIGKKILIEIFTIWIGKLGQFEIRITSKK